MSDAEREARARRRALAKAHHPDLGGDVEEFVRAMRTVSGRPAPPTPGRTSRSAYPVTRTTIVVSRRSRLTRSLRTTTRSLTAVARRRLPRSFPGARRYGRL